MGKKKKMTPADDCCEKYRRKRRFCSDCPLAEGLSKKKRKKLLAKG